MINDNNGPWSSDDEDVVQRSSAESTVNLHSTPATSIVWHPSDPLYHLDFAAYSSPTNSAASKLSSATGRLFSSHNSIAMVRTAHAAIDESNFITQAVSHDTLSNHHISDLYNVPHDSDIYALPLDVVRYPIRPKPELLETRLQRIRASAAAQQSATLHRHHPRALHMDVKRTGNGCYTAEKRNCVASTLSQRSHEPPPVTLRDVRHYLKSLYSSSSDSSDPYDNHRLSMRTNNNSTASNRNNHFARNAFDTNLNPTIVIHMDSENTENTAADNSAMITDEKRVKSEDSKVRLLDVASNYTKKKKLPNRFTSSWKQILLNLFRVRRLFAQSKSTNCSRDTKLFLSNVNNNGREQEIQSSKNINRALPPLPNNNNSDTSKITKSNIDFATSIRRVKDCGWYWGPLSSEAAERILSNEPDGAFIVRDSSDDHYIFSLTFKLNNCVRHVRIDHDQGNFSFGNRTKFKSHTIVDFIENAVEHSRSGRYLFFLHRRPVVGPVRVQLLHPVSRFKQVQSLQHICRFVILKAVRKDLITHLPLPRRLIDYLNTPHYYSEHMIDMEDETDNLNGDTMRSLRT